MRSAMKHVKNAKGEIEYSIGSGNVFADLGLPNAEQLLAKAELTFQISEIIRQRGLTQAEAAEILGIDQPKISALMRGKISSVSMERIYRYLNALGSDVEIVVRPKPRGRAKGIVRVLTRKRDVASAAKTSRQGKKVESATAKRKIGRVRKEAAKR